MVPVITRRFGIDCGHRVTQHESKCRHVHGHRYEFEVAVSADELDAVGRVIDFSVVKTLVGDWLDSTLDHGYIAHASDEVGIALAREGFKVYTMPAMEEPTAENIATLVLRTAQELFDQYAHPIRVERVRCYETPNCWADATRSG